MKLETLRELIKNISVSQEEIGVKHFMVANKRLSAISNER
jgi:hypothetical protein